MQPWFMYPIVVPFGNPNYDVSLGGSHDLDIGCPPNYPITALLSGTVSSVTDPKWGKQVGIKLDRSYNSKLYCAYLHLSGVNPSLVVGSKVSVGDVIGWCGGGTSEAMYNGTTNPTGVNFLNDSFNSSRIQTGFALMDGTVYGGIGWKVFPPVDWSLDPTQIIIDARKNYTPGVDTSEKQFRDVWLASPVSAMPDTGIYNALLSYHKTLFIGTPVTKEINTVNWSNQPIVYQCFSSGYHVEWSSTDHKAHILDTKNQTVVII